MSRKMERYWHMFEVEPEVSFSALLEEVKDSLSFIKSNGVNTYEMLFEADETEAENLRLTQQTAIENQSDSSLSDDKAEALLYDPEAVTKLLKKRRGM